MLAFSLLVVLAAEPGAPDAGVEPPTPATVLIAATTRREYVEELLEDGRHVRFGTDDKGPVHVWRPSYYRGDTAKVVVYLHGFFNQADSAFYEHALPAQFRGSGRNALFVVPEAPSWRTDPVFWEDLEELLKTVYVRARLRPPGGDVMVLAHSGAYRTVAGWLKHPKLKQVVLLDALYGADREFQEWVDGSDGGRQLVLVGFETAERTELFLKKNPTAVKLDDVPYLYDRVKQASAPLLYVNSERYDHMGMITTGRVVPMLLHLLP